MPQHLCQHGAEVILPPVSKAGRNTKMIAIHLREVQFRMAIMFDIKRLFTGMDGQSSLDQHSGCNAKCDKECTEHEGHER